MTRRRVLLAMAVAVLAMGCSGCTTILSQKNAQFYKSGIHVGPLLSLPDWKVYGGTANLLVTLPNAPHYVVDLPFSLAADTVILPWTIFQQATGVGIGFSCEVRTCPTCYPEC